MLASSSSSSAKAPVNGSGAVALDAAGLSLGSDTLLIRFEKGTQRQAISADRERCLALLAVATRGAVAPDSIRHLEAASAYWQRGDKALANFRLIFAGLPRLGRGDAGRVKAAEYLLDQGMTPRELLRELEIDAASLDLKKYDPDQPRVPAGQGEQSGQWTDGFWSGVRHWLEEPVPVYDTDTGTEVGTQPREQAIATNPVTVGAGGAAVLLGVETLLPAAAVETEELTPFAQRYLSVSGGRLGSTTTRQQLYEIAQKYAQSGKYVRLQGDGQAAEEFIRGAGPGTNGGTYVDFTATSADGTKIRVQTIDTLSDGVSPTRAEVAAASRIRAAFPNDQLILIPKRLP